MKQLKKVMFSLLVIIMLLCTFIIKTEVKAQTSTEPQLTVYKNNVSYKDSVYFMYAVSYENIDITQYDIELLFWNTKQDTYTKGTEKYYKEVSRTQTVTGVDCVIYYSEGIAAKNIVDDIYTRAYVKIGDKEYYSEVNKTSVVDYLLRMIEGGTLNTNQKNLFNALLAYGAAAQNNFDYKTDQLATATYYKINVVNGIISDGFTYGRYKENTTITITANDIIDNDFVNWTNSLGDVVSIDKSYQFEITKSDTYTANYKVSETHTCKYTEISCTATCTSEGSVYYECSVCGNQYSEYLGLLPHSYENGICSECGEPEASEGLFFMPNSDNTGYIVNDYGTFEGKDLVIPSTYNSKPVVGISDSAFKGCDFIETVTIPNTILTIGINAFSDCISIKTITIPESVTSIGRDAFYNCTNVTKINFNAINCNDCTSSGVFENVGKEATRTTLTIGSKVTKIPSYLMYYAYYIDILSFESNSVCEGIGEYAFYYCEELKNVNLPNSVTTVSNYAFKYCKSLLSFVGGTGLDSIGESAFEGASILNYVSVPTTLTTIGNKAFSYCTSLESFTIPSSIVTIGQYAFEQCECTILWDNPSIEILDNYSFGNYYGTSFNIPNSVVEIGEFTFTGARYLEKIEFGPNLKVIGKGAFQNCYSITEIYVPQNVTTINAGAFNGCRSIVDITLPFVGESLKPSNSYQSVFGYIFGYEYHNAGYTTPTSKSGLVYQIYTSSLGTSLKYYYYIPASIKTITIMPVESYDLPANAFYGLKDQITKITLCDNFVKIKDSAFSSAKISTVELPSSLNYIKDNSFKDSSVTSVIFKDPNGWSADSKTLSTTDLSDPTIAANYLKKGQYDSGYCHCIWNKIIS